MLRKYGSKETPEHKCYLIVLGPQVANEVKSKILSALQTESDSGVRTKIADCASEIARVLLINSSSWPELFQLCGEFYGSGDIQRRKTAFTIFTGCPSMLIKQQDQNMVKSMFIGGLQDPNPEVHFEALRAAVFYLCVAKKDIRNAMADLIPLIFQVIPPSLVDGVRETEAVDAFGSIIELALLHPKMFSGVLSQAVDYLVSQMKNTGLEDGNSFLITATRQICLEFLISLTESSPGMMRKCPQFATSVVPVCLEWMTELEDSSEWYAVETMDDDDDSTNETAGEQAMDRLAIYLGGKIVLPIAFQLIPALLAAPEWQRRHAALRCVSAIGEGCLKLMETELEKVVSLVVPYLRDPHPRVRHAACNAIGQMCTDFSPMIQTQFHSQILPGLIQIMDDLEHCRVANYGAAALVNFSEGSSKATLAPYIETIITKLMVLMNTGKLFMQEQAVTTLATIADSAGNEFVNFYPRIMPIIIQILQLENKKEFRNLKGKTLECGSLIILAVGKEIFGPDATSFIELLGSIQSSITDEDDPQSSYLLSAWARVCKVMGDDFAPYLNLVLPPLLKTAELKPVMFQVSASEADNFKAEDGWDALPMNDDKTLILKTSAIEDKCTAVEMLLCYAQQMGATFHPYVESILQLVIPMFDFALNEGVRYAASSLVPVLFECWIKANYRIQF